MFEQNNFANGHGTGRPGGRRIKIKQVYKCILEDVPVFFRESGLLGQERIQTSLGFVQSIGRVNFSSHGAIVSLLL